MLKITIIDFVRHNPWGTTNWTTHYYRNGRRITQRAYARLNYDLHSKGSGYSYDHTSERTVEKGGITRYYTEIFYKILDN